MDAMSVNRPFALNLYTLTKDVTWWLKCHAFGSGMDKAGATHVYQEGESFYYMKFEDKDLPELRDRICACYRQGRPLAVSEIVPNKTRFHMDIDCNKHAPAPGAQSDGLVTEEEVMNWLDRFNNKVVKKLLYTGIVTPLTRDTEGVWNWLDGCEEKEIEAIDQIGTDAMVVVGSRVTAEMNPILIDKSETYYSYHVVWPLLAVDMDHFHWSKDWVPKIEDEGLARSKVFGAIDTGLWKSTRKLRGVLCDKPGANRPFQYVTASPGTEDFTNGACSWSTVFGNGLDDSASRRIWSACSLLTGPTQVKPRPVAPSPDPDRMEDDEQPAAAANSNTNSGYGEFYESLSRNGNGNGNGNEDSTSRRSMTGTADSQSNGPARRVRPNARLTSSENPFGRRPSSTPALARSPAPEEEGMPTVEYFRTAFLSPKDWHQPQPNMDRGTVPEYLRRPIDAEFNPIELYGRIMMAYEENKDQELLQPVKDAVEKAITYYVNHYYAWIESQSKGMVVFRKMCPDSIYPELGMKTVEAFKNSVSAGGSMVLYVARTTRDGQPAKPLEWSVNAGKIWLGSRFRLNYNRIIIEPIARRVMAGNLNIWFPQAITDIDANGFKDLPHNLSDGTNATVDLFLDHLKQHICGNNTEVYDHLINCYASLIQKPWEKLNIAFILLGEEGCGKNMAVHPLLAILGKHLCHYSPHQSSVLGRFNSHLMGKCLVLMDEVTSIDKETEGTLRSLITQKTAFYEKKHFDGEEGNQMSTVIAISNSTKSRSSIVLASYKARRYFVLDCESPYPADHEYWKRLAEFLGMNPDSNQWTRSPGVKKIADYFYHHKIPANWNSRSIPQTPALARMKAASFTAVHSWYHECLCSERIIGWSEILDQRRIFGDEVTFAKQSEEQWAAKPLHIKKVTIFECFCWWLKQPINVYQERSNPGAAGVSNFFPDLLKVCNFTTGKRRVLSKAISPDNVVMMDTAASQLTDDVQLDADVFIDQALDPQSIAIPALEVARKYFTSKIPGITFEMW